MSKNHVITKAQQLALQNVQKRTDDNHEQSVARIAKVLERVGLKTDPATLVGKIQHVSQVTINFHPDRLASDDRSVADALLDGGVFKTQFENRNLKWWVESHFRRQT